MGSDEMAASSGPSASPVAAEGGAAATGRVAGPTAPPPLPGVRPPLPGVGLSYAGASTGGSSLHPATVLVGALRAVKNLSWAIVLLLVFRAAGRPGAVIELVVAALGGLQVFGSLLRYLTLRYRIEAYPSPTLVVESGLVFRQRRAIPVGRVQNINIKRDLVHRLLGVAELDVETAAGREAEASLSALSVHEATRLRELLLSLQQTSRAQAAVAGAGSESAAEGRIVYRATVRDLLLAGATRTRVGAVVGGVLGAFYFVADLIGEDGERWSMLLLPTRKVTAALELVVADASAPLVAVLAALLVACLALLAGWLLSIATSLVRYWDFQLLETVDGRLLRRFGLVTVNELAFPRRRLQKLTIDAPLLQRKLGLCQLTAVTAASFQDRDSAGHSMLAPITRWTDVERLGRHVVEGFTLRDLSWRRVSPKARRRWTVRNTVGLTVLTVLPAAVWWSPMAWAAVPVVVVLGAWLAHAQYRTTKYAVERGLIVFRSGVMTRRVRVVPQDRVQLSVVRASPMQRVLGLADLQVFTAANPLAADARLPNLPADVAVRIQDALLRPAGISVAMHDKAKKGGAGEGGNAGLRAALGSGTLTA